MNLIYNRVFSHFIIIVLIIVERPQKRVLKNNIQNLLSDKWQIKNFKRNYQNFQKKDQMDLKFEYFKRLKYHWNVWMSSEHSNLSLEILKEFCFFEVFRGVFCCFNNIIHSISKEIEINWDDKLFRNKWSFLSCRNLGCSL